MVSGIHRGVYVAKEVHGSDHEHMTFGWRIETATALGDLYTCYCPSTLPVDLIELVHPASYIASLLIAAKPNTARKQVAGKSYMHYMMYFFALPAVDMSTTSNIAYVGS